MDATNKDTKDKLACGALNGRALQADEELDTGVIVTCKATGKRLFVPKVFVDLMRYRNRGKD